MSPTHLASPHPAHSRAARTPNPHFDEHRETRKLIAAILRRWAILLLLTMAGFGLAATYCLKAIPHYRAEALIEVAPQEQIILKIDDVTKQSLNQLDVLNTLVMKSTRTEVLRRVVVAEKLTNYPAFKINGAPPTEAEVTRQLATLIKGQLRRNTRLIDITAVHTDPKLPPFLANTVAAQFIRAEIEDHTDQTKQANAALFDEVDRLKKKLEQSDRKLQAYREKYKSVSLEDRQNIVTQKLTTLANQLTELRAERTQIDAQNAAAKQLTNDVARLFNLPAIKADPVVTDLQKQLLLQQSMVNLYSTRYYDAYPKMQAAKNRLQEIEAVLTKAALSALTTLDSQSATVKTREDGLLAAFKEAEQAALELGRIAIDYNILQREMESDRNLYQAILQRLKETDVSKGIEKTSLSLVQRATAPTAPFKPNKPVLVTFGTLLGFLVGMALVLVLAQLDHTIKNVEDAETSIGLPVLAAIPLDRLLLKSKSAVLLSDQSKPATGEAFRSMRATVSLMGRAENRHVILITSALPSEGKTTIAANYAAALSQQGIHTVLIDMDLRRPSLHKVFNLPADTPGVADFLVKNTPVAQITQNTSFPQLQVITAGIAIPNPAEQLAGPLLGELIKELQKHYSAIIIDTAPLLPVADTARQNLSKVEHSIICPY